MSFSEQIIPVILGPTASGKTSLGIELARQLNGEIISVDSRKVYDGLSIGTAVPPGEKKGGAYWVEGIPHYLIGHLAPDHPYTAGDFAKEANQLIETIFSKNKTPILVGGTGFYFKALQKGLPKLPPRNEAIRNKLSADIQSHGLDTLYQQLKSADPEAASQIESNDTHKIIRALEIIQLTGKPYSYWKIAARQPSTHKFMVFGLDYSKPILDQRIEDRSARMVEEGMIEETEAILKKGFSESCPALASFGYREAVHVIQNKMVKQDFLPALIKGTKAYSKRQRTWFRTQIKPLWFQCDQAKKEHIISKIIDSLGKH